jgi:hypothetical protein
VLFVILHFVASFVKFHEKFLLLLFKVKFHIESTVMQDRKAPIADVNGDIINQYRMDGMCVRIAELLRISTSFLEIGKMIINIK